MVTRLLIILHLMLMSQMSYGSDLKRAAVLLNKKIENLTSLIQYPAEDEFENFADDEPNNSGNSEACAHMRDDGKWNDAPCSRSFRFACKKRNSDNWKVTDDNGQWHEGFTKCAALPGGYAYAKPKSYMENLKLKNIAGGSSVWINYRLSSEWLWKIVKGLKEDIEKINNEISEKITSSDIADNAVNKTNSSFSFREKTCDIGTPQSDLTSASSIALLANITNNPEAGNALYELFKPYDCRCDQGERVISGGGWGYATKGISTFLRESVALNHDTWRISCLVQVGKYSFPGPCAGMRITCAKID